ncbi:hypothetical protein GH714_025810 [Hevea brasiliensis]|uniref:JmjC domain-containing protein n=1 Tax=Hevea brasiliensis TaxID=3981 RepID=A0A6A6NJ49_HEVBR|nr:hypothetical protein GH714_025810 [Hevea brasiliensis]
MLSRSAPVFYGDLRSHERVPIPFSTFIGLCKEFMSNAERHEPAVSDAQEQDPLLSGDAPQKIYLAQVPIMNTEDQERVQLGVLREDIQTPAFLETKELASINLWMNSAPSRSSTHYDPHHNVLCIVAGCKQGLVAFSFHLSILQLGEPSICLVAPFCKSIFIPKAYNGEASNHSSVALENPDFSLYPRAECSIEYSQKVTLHAGDALFIPEGWFHQVDSSNLTIAVNFWWRSNIMSSMLEHMDAYYLRRILRRLTDKEMNHILQKASSPSMEKQKMPTCKLLSNGEADQQQRVNLHLLEPYALQVLHDLVSLVHDRVNLIDQSHLVESTSANDSAVSMKGQYDKTATTNVFILEDDPVAKILWTLDPHTLQNVLLSMADNFPRTLEALILHLLSPVGAEVLTQKFDEMDQLTTEENRNKFYEVFYEAFDDQFAAMDAILNGKELFALQAFQNVLDKYLGVSFDVRKPSTG